MLYWTLAGLVISALASHIVSDLILFSGVVLNVMPAAISALATPYFMLGLVSLMLIYLRWVWKHDADLCVAGKMGMATSAKSLVKAYLLSYLANVAKYVSSTSLPVEFELVDTPPLTRRGTFTELLCRTLSLGGFVDFVSIIIRPLEEIRPLLYLRLRTTQMVF